MYQNPTTFIDRYFFVFPGRSRSGGRCQRRQRQRHAGATAAAVRVRHGAAAAAIRRPRPAERHQVGAGLLLRGRRRIGRVRGGRQAVRQYRPVLQSFVHAQHVRAERVRGHA